ncbi:MAG: hypothetical protein GY716_13060 [bacterium]|nr:hypothetical protein [bacterium]
MGTAATVSTEIERLELWTRRSWIAANLLFPFALFLVKWPKPWRAFDGEESPINWFSSLQCALIAVLALGLLFVSHLGTRLGTDPVRRPWLWAVVGAGFFAMSLDEQFQGHEQIREKLLKPNELFTGMEFIMPGDVVLIFFVLVGVALGWYLLPELKQNRASVVMFAVAIVLIGISAVQDALDLAFMHDRDFRHFQTIVEELAEIWAQLLFALSFLLLFFGKLRGLLGRAPQ